MDKIDILKLNLMILSLTVKFSELQNSFFNNPPTKCLFDN